MLNEMFYILMLMYNYQNMYNYQMYKLSNSFLCFDVALSNHDFLEHRIEHQILM